MAFSGIGRKKVAGHVFLLLLDIIVLALAAKVNKFNEFFYVADLFPLALSIVTLVFLFGMLTLDFALDNSWTGLPQVEIGIFGVLSILWLAFNSFSTSRWRNIPMNCGAIPSTYPGEKVWCQNVQALKAFIWITFVLCLCITIWTVRYTLTQYKLGNKHILSVPLSRYRPQLRSTEKTGYNNGRGSEFLQFEKVFDNGR